MGELPVAACDVSLVVFVGAIDLVEVDGEDIDSLCIFDLN